MTEFQKYSLKVALQHIVVFLVGCCVGTLIVFMVKYV